VAMIYIKFFNSRLSNALFSHNRIFKVAALISCLVVTGCASGGKIFSVSDVKPWERGTLARDDMQLITDAMDQSVDDHIYFSKEASTGGSSIQGGGCGCN